MIRFEKVSKSLGNRLILDRVSYEIHPNETFVILGASGSGKSVSLKHMVRLLTPDRGKIWIGDDLISAARGKDLERMRSRFGMLFQSGALMQWLSVADNVALPLREHTRLTEGEIDARVRKTLSMVQLEDAYDKSPSDLSGGMRKRVGLARAVIMEPEIILYDEPTSGLDPVTARTIDTLIDCLRKELGIISVLVTHDLHSALAIATRIGMLHQGKMVEISTPEEFVRSEKEVVKNFLAAQYITKKGSWEKGVVTS